MVNWQEWLNGQEKHDTREKRAIAKELMIDNVELEGEIDLSDFFNLERIYISHFIDDNKLQIKDKENYKNKIIKLVNAQKWLEENYPQETRKKIKKLDISNKNLEGDLTIQGFTNLQKFDCSQNQLTKLELSDCDKLVEIDCWGNQLVDLKFISLFHLQTLNAWENKLTELDWDNIGDDLTILSLSNNNFSKHDLDCFRRFTSLEELYLGTDKEERIEEELYNRFAGSLEPLKGLEKLEKLQIEATDIDDGLEYLPKNLERIVRWRKYDYNEKKTEFKVKEIEEILEDYKEGKDQDYYNYQTWKKYRNEWVDKGFKDQELKHLELIGVKMFDNKFAEHLRKNDLVGEYIARYIIEKNDYHDAQNWLDYFYPAWTRGERLNIDNRKLKGSLKLDGESFKELKEIVIKCEILREIKLVNLPKLENFRANPCRLNKITIKGCHNIKELNLANNELTDVDFLDDLDPNKLTHLSIHSNNFKDGHLHFLSRFTKLERLFLDNCDEKKFNGEIYNRFCGSLEHLKGLEKLKYLSISNTDIESGLEHLSRDIRRIGCISKWKRKEEETDGVGFFKIRWKLEKQEKFLGDKHRREIYELEKEEKIPNYIINGYHVVTFGEKKLSFGENLSLLNSSPALYEEWEIRGFTRKEIKKWIGEAGFSPYEAPYVKEWEECGFTCEEVKEWKEKNGLESNDYDFANYLKKAKEREEYVEKIDSLSLYNLWKHYKEEQRVKTSQLVKTVATNPPEMKAEWKNSSEEENRFKKKSYNEIYPVKIPGENFSWQKRDEAIDLPTKLYDIKRYQSDKVIVEDIIKAAVEKVELDSDIKNYAILSYVCGPYVCGNKEHKDCRKCRNYIYKGLKESLARAAKTMELINEKKCRELKDLISKISEPEEIKEKVKNFSTTDYLWIDQFCIDQSNPHEKAEEIHKMHQYYSNAEVTLVPINSNVEEKVKKFDDKFTELCNFFKNSGYKKEKGINEDTVEIIKKKTKEIFDESLVILEKVISSEWFSRSWTFQEGWLSKRTIFMFNDCLVDGRFLALMWSLSHDEYFNSEEGGENSGEETLWKNAIFWEGEEKSYDSLEKFWQESFVNEKTATPIGWVYHKDGYSQRDIVYLSLNEALKEMKTRRRSVAIDGIYSILSLLPYGQKVEIEYSKNPNHQYTQNELRKALTDVMKAAINAGYAEPLAWYGSSSRMPGLCWTPHIDKGGSTSIEDYIKVDCVPERIRFKPEGMEIIGSELIVGSISNNNDNDEKQKKKEFLELEIGVEVGELEDKKVKLKGTKEVIRAVEKGNILVVFNKSEWKSDRPFALLVTGGENNIRHRVGLVELLEGEENLKGAKRKKLVIGLDESNIQAAKFEKFHHYLSQVEVSPK